MSEKMKNLMVRTLSGAVLAVVVLGAVMWSQWSFGALLLAMLVGGMLEFYGLAEKQGNAPQRILGTAAGIVLFALNFAFVSDDIEILGGASQAFACGMAFMLLLIPAMFICELYRKQQNPASGIGTTLMGVCYIALPLSLMCYIPIIGSDVWTPWVMIFYIFIIWANDVFAYLVGMSLGRHRMFERLSPKKSWEGFFGGLAGAVAMGYVAAPGIGCRCMGVARSGAGGGRNGRAGRSGGVDVQTRRGRQGFGKSDSRTRRCAGPFRRHAAFGAVRLRLYAFCYVTAILN